jgi:hypothetical protein
MARRKRAASDWHLERLGRRARRPAATRTTCERVGRKFGNAQGSIGVIIVVNCIRRDNSNDSILSELCILPSAAGVHQINAAIDCRELILQWTRNKSFISWKFQWKIKMQIALLRLELVYVFVNRGTKAPFVRCGNCISRRFGFHICF